MFTKFSCWASDMVGMGHMFDMLALRVFSAKRLIINRQLILNIVVIALKLLKLKFLFGRSVWKSTSLNNMILLIKVSGACSVKKINSLKIL